jgi:hypothetical protein
MYARPLFSAASLDGFGSKNTTKYFENKKEF